MAGSLGASLPADALQKLRHKVEFARALWRAELKLGRVPSKGW